MNEFVGVTTFDFSEICNDFLNQLKKYSVGDM